METVGLEDNSGPISEANRKVVNYVERTFDNVLLELHSSPPGCPRIILRHITSALPPSGHDVRITPWQVDSREIKYSWPGSTAKEAWQFGSENLCTTTAS